MKQHAYTKGDRVRVTCNCPGARTGDEGTIMTVHHPSPDSVQSFVILIDTNPATTHGTTVSEHEIEPVTQAVEVQQ